VTVNDDPELTVVHVVSRTAQAETTAAGEGENLTQPEVIKPERREKEE
jgi:large subunit ribosomal protein L25